MHGTVPAVSHQRCSGHRIRILTQVGKGKYPYPLKRLMEAFSSYYKNTQISIKCLKPTATISAHSLDHHLTQHQESPLKHSIQPKKHPTNLIQTPNHHHHHHHHHNAFHPSRPPRRRPQPRHRLPHPLQTIPRHHRLRRRQARPRTRPRYRSPEQAQQRLQIRRHSAPQLGGETQRCCRGVRV